MLDNPPKMPHAREGSIFGRNEHLLGLTRVSATLVTYTLGPDGLGLPVLQGRPVQDGGGLAGACRPDRCAPLTVVGAAAD